MQQLVNRCQAAAVLVMRALPRLRGHGRIAGTINRYLRRAGVSPLVTTRMRQGHRLRLDVRVPSQAQALYSGDYDSAKLAILCRMMPPGAVSLDVGANIGFYAVPLGLAARAAGGRVIAFEPMAANYRRLVENLELNDLQGTVDPHPIGLAAMPGTAELSLREDFHDGGEVGNASLVVDDGLDARFQKVTIALARLDDLWPGLAQNRLDIVKVDIEGHEDQFLLGAREVLNRHRPLILAELNRWFYRRRGIDVVSAIPALLPHDYVFYRPAGPTIRWSVRGTITELSRLDSLAAYGDMEDVFLVPIERAAQLCQIAEDLRGYPPLITFGKWHGKSRSWRYL